MTGQQIGDKPLHEKVMTELPDAYIGMSVSACSYGESLWEWARFLGPLLLPWINFNLSMDK